MRIKNLLAALALFATADTANALYAAEELACSHWECVCGCEVAEFSDPLINPETNTPFFYPGGSKDECSGHEGNSCIGTTTGGGTYRGELTNCDWILVPDDDSQCLAPSALLD